MSSVHDAVVLIPKCASPDRTSLFADRRNGFEDVLAFEQREESNIAIPMRDVHPTFAGANRMSA